MAHWHEPLRLIGGWQFRSERCSRLRVMFRGADVRVALFEGHFLRYEGSAEPFKGRYPSPGRDPGGWVELWPSEPLFASSMEEAKAKFAPLLAQLERGDFTDFERRPYVVPRRPALVRQIEHPTRLAQALITCDEAETYRVSYRVYARNGHYFPAASPSISTDPEMEWGMAWPKNEAGKPLRTLADNLESAERVAIEELDRLVQRDPEIALR